MAFTTHGHQIMGTTAEKRPPGMMVARCGGPGICKACSREAGMAQYETKPQEASMQMEDRPEMLSSGGQLLRARELIWWAFYSDATKIHVGGVYVVWFSKTLQNWKALVSTDVKDDMYYEVTYNGDKGETYIDAYKKVKNLVIPD